MKTHKFTNMLESFECDLRLAKDNEFTLLELNEALHDKDSDISKDLELLEELSFLLRNGKAEINLVEDNIVNSINERYISLYQDVNNGLYDYARDAFHIEIGKLAMLLMLSDIENKESEEYKIEVLQGIWEARYYKLAYKKEDK